MKIAILMLGWYALLVMTWVFYLAVMSLSKHREELTPVAKFHAYGIILPVGLFLDAMLNLLVCFAFLRLPHDWLLTGTLKRYINTDTGWRCAVSAWLCRNLLNQFDPNGTHC